MFALFAISGIIGGTALACLAPRSKYEKQMEIVGAIVFVAALASIGASLATRLCI